MAPITFNIGPHDYLFRTRALFFLSIIVFGGFFLLVAYDHFINRHVEGHRLAVIAAISLTGIVLSWVVPLWVTRKQCADFDSLILPGEGKIILQHSFLHTQVELEAQEILTFYIEEQERATEESEIDFFDDLVLETKDGRKYQSEPVNRASRTEVEELKAIIPVLHQYLSQYQRASP